MRPESSSSTPTATCPTWVICFSLLERLLADSTRCLAGRNAQPHAQRTTDETSIPIPPHLFDDPQLAASRGSACRRDDKALVLGERLSTVAARASEEGCRGERARAECSSSLRRLTGQLLATQGEVELQSLKRLPPGEKAEDLKRYYDLSQRIVELNTSALEGVLSHPSAAKIFAAGRIVILSDGVSPILCFVLLSHSVMTSSLLRDTALPRQCRRVAQICSACNPSLGRDRSHASVFRSRVCASRDSRWQERCVSSIFFIAAHAHETSLDRPDCRCRAAKVASTNYPH